MRILIFSWRGPGHPNAGGAEISTHEHAKGWVKMGHEVTLFTSIYQGGKEEEVVDGVRVIRFGSQVLGVHWEAFKWYLFKNKQKFDLVIDQFHGIPFFTPLYVRTKKLAFIHEVAKEVWRLNPWRGPINLLPRIGEVIEPLIFKTLYKNIPFMTVSESTKTDLIDWGIPEENIKVVFNGINIIYPKANKKEDINTLIFLGALSRDKGVEEAIEVFSEVRQKYDKKKINFWIVGKSDPDYLLHLKNKVKRQGIEKDVKFFGFVSEQEKFKLLSLSHILVNTSVREGWGLVVIEAAAVGTPTVAFNSPGLKDSIKDGVTGLLSKQNTVEQIALLTEKLLKDSDLYNRLSKESIKWSKNFDWQKSTKESVKILEDLAG